MTEISLEDLRDVIRDEIKANLIPLSKSTELLTEKETADILKIKPQTMAVWRTKNIGPAPTTIGSNKIRYTRSAVEKYVSLQTAPR